MRTNTQKEFEIILCCIASSMPAGTAPPPIHKDDDKDEKEDGNKEEKREREIFCDITEDPLSAVWLGHTIRGPISHGRSLDTVAQARPCSVSPQIHSSEMLLGS